MHKIIFFWLVVVFSTYGLASPARGTAAPAEGKTPGIAPAEGKTPGIASAEGKASAESKTSAKVVAPVEGKTPAVTFEKAVALDVTSAKDEVVAPAKAKASWKKGKASAKGKTPAEGKASLKGKASAKVVAPAEGKASVKGTSSVKKPVFVKKKSHNLRGQMKKKGRFPSNATAYSCEETYIDIFSIGYVQLGFGCDPQENLCVASFWIERNSCSKNQLTRYYCDPQSESLASFEILKCPGACDSSGLFCATPL